MDTILVSILAACIVGAIVGFVLKRRAPSASEVLAEAKSASELIASGTKSEAAYFTVVRGHYSREEHKEIIELSKEFIAAFPDSVPLNLYLGYAHFGLRTFDVASTFLSKSIELMSTPPNLYVETEIGEARFCLAICLFRLERFEESSHQEAMAKKLNPKLRKLTIA